MVDPRSSHSPSGSPSTSSSPPQGSCRVPCCHASCGSGRWSAPSWRARWSVGRVAIVQASLRPSPWPIVVFLVVSDLLTSALLLRVQRTPVRLKPDHAAIRDLWQFAGGQLGDAAVNYWSRNADNVLVGKVLGSEALGIYSRCYVILLFPVQQVAQVVNRVMFPAMSTVQDDRPADSVGVPTDSGSGVGGDLSRAARSWWSRPIRWSSPYSVGSGRQPSRCCGCSRWSQRSSASERRRVGCIRRPGHTTLMFRVTCALTVVVIAAFVIGVQWGLMGVAYSYLAWNCLSLPVNVIYAGRGVEIRLGQILRDIAVPAMLSVGLGLVLFGTTFLLRGSLGVGTASRAPRRRSRRVRRGAGDREAGGVASPGVRPAGASCR